MPQVIDKLREQGYQFVSVPDLIGKKRAEVMMPLSTEEKLEARADGFIFGIWHWFRLSIATVFIVGIVMVSGRSSFEILQKCVVAGAPILCAVSAPSSLAIDVAQRFGVTLIGFLRDERANIYSHPERVDVDH